MINEETEPKPIEVFCNLDSGECIQFDMTLPIQMLFEDVMTFVSTI